jgi:hypothetical protein
MKPILLPAVLVLSCLLSLPAFAVPAVTRADTSGGRLPAVSGEIDLDGIEIQGRIEQPNVILVPTRLDPALGDTTLERSFENEIRNGAGGFTSPDTVIRRVEPAPSIRSSIKMKRK